MENKDPNLREGFIGEAMRNANAEGPTNSPKLYLR